MAAQTIPFDVVDHICAGPVAEGIAYESLLASSLIERQYGDERDRISPAQLLLLSMNANLSIQDAAHGLGMKPLALACSVLGVRIMLGSATLESAFHALERLYDMAGSTVRLKLATEGEHAYLMVRGEGRTDLASYTVEDTYLGWMFMHCGQFLGRPLAVTEVRTRNPTHVSLGRPHFAVGAPVRHGASATLQFPRTLLASKRAASTSDTPIWDCMRPWIEWAEATPHPAISSGDLAMWSLTVDQMAEQSGVSSATMRRRLEQQRGGYRSARQRARANAGIALLRSSETSVESIAAELGYADARSFRRFLKAATGKTPHEIRGEPIAADPGSSETDGAIRRRVRAMASELDRL